ncbi:MAG: hypothetical protein Q7R83_03330 [bacterium]|nr:hypothetical protein [bacterium]
MPTRSFVSKPGHAVDIKTFLDTLRPLNGLFGSIEAPLGKRADGLIISPHVEAVIDREQARLLFIRLDRACLPQRITFALSDDPPTWHADYYKRGGVPGIPYCSPVFYSGCRVLAQYLALGYCGAITLQTAGILIHVRVRPEQQFRLDATWDDMDAIVEHDRITGNDAEALQNVLTTCDHADWLIHLIS